MLKGLSVSRNRGSVSTLPHGPSYCGRQVGSLGIDTPMLPQAIVHKIETLSGEYRRGRFTPMGTDHTFLKRAAETDPSALTTLVHQLCVGVNSGNVDPGFLDAAFGWLADFASTSSILREEVKKSLHTDLLEYYAGDDAPGASRLAAALALELPRHYFDVCRQILAGAQTCVVIIGAGFSYSSTAPLLTETRFLAVDVLQRLGEPTPSQMYDERPLEAWQRIAKDGREEFQRLASGLLETKQPAEQHYALSKLFHQGVVGHIVSFNWDSLVEAAYLKLYGEVIPTVSDPGSTSAHALWKMHGDAADPIGTWVLPYEEGSISEELLEVLNVGVTAAIIIGYNEREAVVRERLIAPLDVRGAITRIGPELEDNPPAAFRDTATQAMMKLEAGFKAARAPADPGG